MKFMTAILWLGVFVVATSVMTFSLTGCQPNGLPTTQIATLTISDATSLTNRLDDAVKVSTQLLQAHVITLAQAETLKNIEHATRDAIGKARDAIASGQVDAASLFTLADGAVNGYIAQRESAKSSTQP